MTTQRWRYALTRRSTKTYLSPKQFTGFDVVIVDEASMVMLPALYYAAGLARERVIVSGDFRQLMPIVETNQKAIDQVIGGDVFGEAGITKSIQKGRFPDRVTMLNTQYRMRKLICDLISSKMYRGKLRTERSVEDSQKPPPAPYDQTLVLIDTSRVRPFENRDIFGSKYNLMHALLVRNLCLHLRDEGFISGPTDVGVATPYAAQAKLLKRLLTGSDLNQDVAAGTVHRFQGDEKRLMILDLPDGFGAWVAGMFLQADSPEDTGASLFNVAITRARDYLAVVANLTHLERTLPDRALMRDILFDMQTKGKIIDGQEVLALRPVLHDLTELQRQTQTESHLSSTAICNREQFERGFRSDLDKAEKSVAIFSGFITPQRVAEYGDLLRRKIGEGVKVRCVTRPPRFNGSIPAGDGKQALDHLESLHCIVDTRSRIHEKAVIIDDRILWFGSLNVLSHSDKTDEMMWRIDDVEAAKQVAIFMTVRGQSWKETGNGISVKKENPDCPECKSRTCFVRGKYGPFWACEECKWRQNIDKPLEPAKTFP